MVFKVTNHNIGMMLLACVVVPFLNVMLCAIWRDFHVFSQDLYSTLSFWTVKNRQKLRIEDRESSKIAYEKVNVVLQYSDFNNELMIKNW